MKMHAYLSELHECKTQIKGSEQCMETTTTNTNKIKQLRAFKKMPYARIEVKKKTVQQHSTGRRHCEILECELRVKWDAIRISTKKWKPN